jgi:phospholipase/carboxylesterase
MARSLKFARKAAHSGQAKSLVIFLHGYGADGADLLSLADVLGPHLPDTSFVAPDAPDRVPGAPFGCQWFSIPRFDGSTEDQSRAGLARSAEDLTAFLSQRAAEEGLPLSAVALFGFSQGAMMAMHVAPRLGVPLAGVVAISGRLVVPERLAGEVISRPSVLLIHGDQDEVVPFGNMAFAGEELTKAGFEVFGHVMKGSGHGIAPDGLQVALGFLAEVLPKS